MRSNAVIDFIISKIPVQNRRICPIFYTGGSCACMGCIHKEVTIEEFEAWKERWGFCEHCLRFNEKVSNNNKNKKEKV